VGRARTAEFRLSDDEILQNRKMLEGAPIAA